MHVLSGPIDFKLSMIIPDASNAAVESEKTL